MINKQDLDFMTQGRWTLYFTCCGGEQKCVEIISQRGGARVRLFITGILTQRGRVRARLFVTGSGKKTRIIRGGWDQIK